MSAWVPIFGVSCFAAGGAVVWFAKEPIQKLVLGAEATAARLRAKADAIRAAVQK